MKLIVTIKEKNILDVVLKEGDKAIDRSSLTISQNLDNMLITTIDKILAKNRIERLPLKSLIIRGKMSPGMVSSMVMRTIKNALEI